MELVTVALAFLFVALIIKLAKPSRQKKDENHCFSIKNVKYTMMDKDES